MGVSADQRRAPLYEALADYVARHPVVFHVPGHKQGRGAPPALRAALGEQGLALDLTEAPGLDDLHAPAGCIAEAQALAAAAFGAGRSHFLVGGTTAGLHALILAACRPGDTILVPRHAHRSVLGGLILAGARPHYLRPDVDPDLDLPLGVAPSELAAALGAAPGARAVLLVHPTYHGVPAALPDLIALAHGRGLPVLVDEAHGAHFAFHPALPISALQAGADATVQSLHKTGGSLTQSSLLHLGQHSRLDPQRVQDMLRLVQSTSPSYLLLASLDLARRELALNGREQWERALATAAHARRRLGLVVWDVPGADPTRLVLDVRRWRLSGPAAAAQLWRQGVAVELAGQQYVLVILGPTDGPAEVERLAAALDGLEAADGQVLRPGPPPWPEVILTPREAFLSEQEPVALAQARGRIAAELVAPYPPGIPVLAPGERITADVITYLCRCRSAGLHLQGPADPALGTIRVVRE